MEVDPLQASRSNNPSPLTRIWAHLASRREREDEDLVSEPGSPELSEDEGKTETNGNLDPDEPEFLSDSKSRVFMQRSLQQSDSLLVSSFMLRELVCCSLIFFH